MPAPPGGEWGRLSHAYVILKSVSIHIAKLELILVIYFKKYYFSIFLGRGDAGSLIGYLLLYA